MRIDSHQHFWIYQKDKHSWINDEMSVIRKDFLPHDLRPHLSTHQLDGTIAVQADEKESETEFLLSLSEKHDFIKGVVGWIDLKNSSAENRMQSFADQKKLVGFRAIMQGSPDADYLTNQQFIKNVNKLSQFDWSYDLLIYHDQMPSLLKFVDQIKDTRLILDHIGKPDIRRGELDNWSKSLRSLAQHPDIYCKLSGMLTEANFKKWTYDQLKPYMELVFEAFGPDRICYGSDWPVCLVAGTYAQTMGVVERYLEEAALETKNKIFGLNAVNFYKL